MEAIINYFDTIPTSHRSILLFGGLAFFIILEYGVPFFRYKTSKWKHIGLNLFFNFTTIIVNFLMAFILLGASEFAMTNGIGILNWISMPLWAVLVVGMLLMDLVSAYTPHWVEHHVKWMWQFHVVHHSDQYVDVTTGNRHHPGESVIRFVFTVVATIIVGAPIWLIMLYQAVSVVFAQLTHANIKVPQALDDVLSYVIVTPYMHRVHHHYRQPYSDTNYGNIFSIWDRLFGTFSKVDNSKLVYGVDTYMDVHQTNHIGELLKIPFAGYREHIQYDKEEVL